MSANPGPRHEERRRVLDALAILGGCRESLMPFLPDGRRPDVLRFDALGRHLFVGDAKDTETAGCGDTRERLIHYASWLRANSIAAGSGTLALCHPPDDAGRWSRLLEGVARAQGFRDVRARRRDLDAETAVSWVELHLPTEPSQAASRRECSAAPTWATTA